jgi:hypothetical protein
MTGTCTDADKWLPGWIGWVWKRREEKRKLRDDSGNGTTTAESEFGHRSVNQ